MLLRQILALWILLLTGAIALADDSDPASVEFFEKRIRPLIENHCVECHGEDVAEAKLRVDSLAHLLAGGERGPAIVIGKGKESLIVRAMGHGETLQMPPEKKLPQEDILWVTKWIDAGAKWPNESPATTPATSPPGEPVQFSAEQLSHWAFQPATPVAIPTEVSREWCQSPIDAFIFETLQANQLRPAPATDRKTWLRRVTYDLTGLPPTAEELEEFLSDSSPNADSKVVDRLLSSPRYGEKYGRHWLDVARYADSNGLDENLAYANAFRYRDYVISAFNSDKPFDRFTHEQIAGDLLDHRSESEEIDGVIGTGFLALGAKMLAEDDPVKMQMDIIDEQLDTIGKCFMGMTFGCARCHNHKYDPIDLRDYYAMAGIFKSSKTMENHNVVAVWQERPIGTREVVTARDALLAQVNESKQKLTELRVSEKEKVLQAERTRSSEYLKAAFEALSLKQKLASAPAFGALEENARPEGSRLFEAEDYDRGNVIKDTTNYGAGIGVLVNRGELPNFTEYDFEVAASGTYQVETRYAAAAARPCRLLVNGRIVIDTICKEATGSWTPESQKWFTEGFISLPQGKVTLRLERNDAVPHVDKLLLVPVSGGESLAESDQANLVPEFVQTWTTALEKSREKADSIFGIATDLAAGKNARDRMDDGSRSLLAIIGAGELTTTDVLQKYSELIDLFAVDGTLKPSFQESVFKTLTQTQLDEVKNFLYAAEGAFRVPENVDPLLPMDVQNRIKEMQGEITQRESTITALPTAMSITDAPAVNEKIHFRGSHLTLGAEVPRGFPRALATTPNPSLRGSGRREFAEWLTSNENALTRRVLANRFWRWHFGEGIVRSVDNFGLLGEKPTHPALLEYLASRILDREWSLKGIHRDMVLSSAYRMSSTFAPEAANQDPENRLLWRFPRRRLTAEEIRDTLLFVGESIELKMGDSYLPTPNRQYVTSTANVNPLVYNIQVRSVYVPVVRSALYEVFQAFDFADPSVLAGGRDSTTVAPQALFMLNSELTANASKNIAADLLRTSTDDRSRIQHAFEALLMRAPTAEELDRGLLMLGRVREVSIASGLSADAANEKSWQALCRSLLATNEFVYLD